MSVSPGSSMRFMIGGLPAGCSGGGWTLVLGSVGRKAVEVCEARRTYVVLASGCFERVELIRKPMSKSEALWLRQHAANLAP